MEPGTADLCFLLESIENVRKKVDSLINIRKDVVDLQTAAKSLLQPQPASYSSVLMAPQQKSAVLYQHNSSNLSQLFNSQPLRVNLQLLQNSNNSVSSVGSAVSSNNNTFRLKPAVIGTKSTADGSLKLKVSTVPRIFHLCRGNLIVSVKSEDLSDYLKDVGINVLTCDIFHMSRFVDSSTIRSISAHVQVDSKNNDKMVQPGFWESGLIFRPWKQLRHNNVSSANDLSA